MLEARSRNLDFCQGARYIIIYFTMDTILVQLSVHNVFDLMLVKVPQTIPITASTVISIRQSRLRFCE